MRIISWNANGKFREKFPFILNEDADIYVIQECENPEISNSDEYIEFASNYYWVGENQYYGLGIFAKNNVKLELMDLDAKGLRYFIPVNVNDDFNLLGVGPILIWMALKQVIILKKLLNITKNTRIQDFLMKT